MPEEREPSLLHPDDAARLRYERIASETTKRVHRSRACIEDTRRLMSSGAGVARQDAGQPNKSVIEENEEKKASGSVSPPGS